MKQYFRITEIVWMIMSILAIITTVYMLIIKNSDNAMFALVITVFCLVMWRMRRIYNRKMMQASKKNENPPQG